MAAKEKPAAEPDIMRCEGAALALWNDLKIALEN